MGTLKIMDVTGHTELKYELEDPESVQKAEQEYNRRISKGAAAFIELEDGSYVSVPRERAFEAKQSYIMIPQIAGG